MIELVDTHAHLQFKDYGADLNKVLGSAASAGVNKIIVPSTDVETSVKGVELAKTHANVWAAVGVHPHEAKNFTKVQLRSLRNMLDQDKPEQGNEKNIKSLIATKSQNPESRKLLRKIVAIGETGLDYHYENSPRASQKQMLEAHLQLASDYDLPVIFHVRDAHQDFWPIFDNFSGVKGVLHSFSATKKELDEALKRGLYVGLNGIMTFTKNQEQLEAARSVPKDRLILETDAPFLTPVPFRGKLCKPEHVRLTAEFLAALRDEQLEDLAKFTSFNASQLFGLK